MLAGLRRSEWDDQTRSIPWESDQRLRLRTSGPSNDTARRRRRRAVQSGTFFRRNPRSDLEDDSEPDAGRVAGVLAVDRVPEACRDAELLGDAHVGADAPARELLRRRREGDLPDVVAAVALHVAVEGHDRDAVQEGDAERRIDRELIRRALGAIVVARLDREPDAVVHRVLQDPAEAVVDLAVADRG